MNDLFYFSIGPALVCSYLSEEHCEGVADGCVLTALTADVARSGD